MANQKDVDRTWDNYRRGIPNEHVTPPVRNILNEFVNECATQCVNAERLEEERRGIEEDAREDNLGSPWSASRERED